MGTGIATKRVPEPSPRFRARLAGLFQALEGLTFTCGEVVILGKLVVSGNAAATAASILGHERLFRLGFVSCLIGVMCHIVWALLYYELFKPVNRRLNLLALFVILVGCAVQAVTSLLYLFPLLVLQGGSALSAFTAEQLQVLAYTFIKLNWLAFDIYLVLFGLWCVLVGCLIFRSTFLPRILGVLLVIDGLGWMTYMSPPLGVYLFPIIAAASGVAELPLQLWLLIVGVNDQRWREQASAAWDGESSNRLSGM